MSRRSVVQEAEGLLEMGCRLIDAKTVKRLLDNIKRNEREREQRLEQIRDLTTRVARLECGALNAAEERQRIADFVQNSRFEGEHFGIEPNTPILRVIAKEIRERGHRAESR